MELKIYRNGVLIAQTDYFHVARAIIRHLKTDAGQNFGHDLISMTLNDNDYDISGDWSEY